MDQIVEYFFDQMIQLNHPWLYYTVINISSNGVLYTNKKVQDFFQKYHFLCTFNISIDGNKELHDSCRIDQYGKGSYDQAMQAVKDYRLKYNKITNVLAINNTKIIFLLA